MTEDKLLEYFQKNGVIYGVSSKHTFGGWEHSVELFDDYEKANRWLNTEQRDFRERELFTKAGAIKLAGKKAVEATPYYIEPQDRF
ncbi:MAG: hypothetical protein RR365_14810 [Bacteroides sp.]